jgi:hypothetical protein
MARLVRYLSTRVYGRLWAKVEDGVSRWISFSMIRFRLKLFFVFVLAFDKLVLYYE